jgi:putative cell wall-binding protein
MPRSWQIILGSGVQGTVEEMLLETKEGVVPVAVKKTSITQQRKRRMEVFKRELRALARI